MGTIVIYDRATALSDVAGRIDYISSDERQEHLEAVASTTDDPLFWKRLSADCQTAWKQSGGNREEKSCCEAREVQYALPNSARNCDLKKKASDIAKDFKKKHGVDCCVAIHWNSAESNLHVHIVFAERQLLSEPVIRRADRNAFIDENGFRKRTKKEILDENGELRKGCKIIPKGEIISERYFGDKDQKFSSKSWLKDHKQEVANWINEELEPDLKRVVFDPHGPYLAQLHVGKGRTERQQRRITEYNRLVKAFNKLVREEIIDPAYAKKIKTYVMLSPDRSKALAGLMCGVKLSAEGNPEAEAILEETVLKGRSREFLVDTLESYKGGNRTMYDKNDDDEKRVQQLHLVIGEISSAKTAEEWEDARLRYAALSEETDRKTKELEEIREGGLVHLMSEDETYQILNNKEFYRTSYKNSRTGEYHKTNLFDENGRRRSLLELILLLAVTVIKAEFGLWEPTPTQPEKGSNGEFTFKTNWRIQNMLDSIQYAREEDVNTPQDIGDKLKQAGSACSRAKSVYKRTYNAKAKMEPINKAVLTFRATQEISEKIQNTPKGEEKELLIQKHAAELKRHLDAKNVLKQYGIETEEHISDFEKRYSKITTDLADHKEKLDIMKKRYSKLKRLHESTLMAQYEQYCYGPMYTPGRKVTLTQQISAASVDDAKLQSEQSHEKKAFKSNDEHTL